jgi:hypothetical protein
LSVSIASDGKSDRLERGDDAVASEQRREPRDARREVRLAVGGPVVAQHGEVAHRPADRPIEQLVVGRDAGGIGRAVRRRARGPLGAAGRSGRRRAAVALLRGPAGHLRVGRDRPADRQPLVRLQPDAPAGDHADARPIGLVADGIEPAALDDDRRRAADAIEAVVREDRAIAKQSDRLQLPAQDPRIAANLEDVGHVDAETELQRELLGVLRVVHDQEPFAQPAVDPAGAGQA